MSHTLNCIVCYQPADIQTGHVLKDGKKVTASWCELHLNSTAAFLMITRDKPAGCYGEWKEQMGISTRTNHPAE